MNKRYLKHSLFLAVSVAVFFGFFSIVRAYQPYRADGGLGSCDPVRCSPPSGANVVCNNGPSRTDSGGCGEACGPNSKTNTWSKYTTSCRRTGRYACSWRLIYTTSSCSTADKYDEPGPSPYLRAGYCNCTVGGRYKICCNGSTPVNSVRANVDGKAPSEAACPSGSTTIRWDGVNLPTCPVSDVCTNIAGNQATMPAGYEDPNGDRVCTQICSASTPTCGICDSGLKTNCAGSISCTPHRSCDSCAKGPWTTVGSCGGGEKCDPTEVPQERTVCAPYPNEKRCSLDDRCCIYSEWSVWSACSEPCGGGTQTRTRLAINRDTTSCTSTSDSQACNTQACIIDLCTNLGGVQATMPAGYEDPNGDRVCTLINTPPTVIPSPASLVIGSGPSCIARERFRWDFSDLESSSQSAYRLQVSRNPSFTQQNLQFDSGKVASGAEERFIAISSTPVAEFTDGIADGDGQLAFNRTYYWRVQVYDASDAGSGFSAGTSFRTLLHPYPFVDFSWAPQKPSQGEPVQFGDQTIFDSGSASQSWNWTFPADTTPSSSAQQNPQAVFGSDGNQTIILRVTDNTLATDSNSGNGQCSKTDTIDVKLPLPDFKEIAPVSSLGKIWKEFVSFFDNIRLTKIFTVSDSL